MHAAARAVGASRKLVEPCLLLRNMGCVQAVLHPIELPTDLEDLFVCAKRLAVLAKRQAALEPHHDTIEVRTLEVLSGACVAGKVKR